MPGTHKGSVSGGCVSGNYDGQQLLVQRGEEAERSSGLSVFTAQASEVGSKSERQEAKEVLYHKYQVKVLAGTRQS